LICFANTLKTHTNKTNDFRAVCKTTRTDIRQCSLSMARAVPPRIFPWPRQTLGGVVRQGESIIVWCNNYACGYRLVHGAQYRAVLTVADLTAYAERYGDDLEFGSFRRRLRCRHCGCRDVSTIADHPYVTPKERAEREARDRENR
jgi:hypothetical protein